jgi:hypothetical protein
MGVGLGLFWRFLAGENQGLPLELERSMAVGEGLGLVLGLSGAFFSGQNVA